MSWNRISHACRVAGCYTISAGPSSPAVVLGRLLDALTILDPDTHRLLTRPGGKYACVPRDALRDESNAWWRTEDAGALLELLFVSINAAAPEGFACMCAEGNRIELARIGPKGAVEDSCSHHPPQTSGLHARVR